MMERTVEGLRRSGDPDFNVLELFLLHKRSEVLARCKVQAHEADYAVILVIGGEVERITRCTSASEVRSIAAAWEADLIAESWHPVQPPTNTIWRSRHDKWILTVLMAYGGRHCYSSGYYSGTAYWHREGPPPVNVPLVIPLEYVELTVHLAQMEIVRELAEQTGHRCSASCSAWTFELRVRDSTGRYV